MHDFDDLAADESEQLQVGDIIDHEDAAELYDSD